MNLSQNEIKKLKAYNIMIIQVIDNTPIWDIINNPAISIEFKK